MVMSCDYFIPPGFGSMLSVGSIFNLFTSVLPEWYSWRASVVERQGNKALSVRELPFAFSKDAPQVLPILITNYSLQRTQNDDGHWIIDEVSSNFVRTLRSFMKDLPTYKQPMIEGHKLPGRDMMVQCFKPRDDGMMVSCLVSHQPQVISVSEELGRTVSELNTDLYMAEFKLEVRKSRAQRKAVALRAAPVAVEEFLIEETGETAGRLTDSLPTRYTTKACMNEFILKMKYMQAHYEMYAETLLTMTRREQPAGSANKQSSGSSKKGNPSKRSKTARDAK